LVAVLRSRGLLGLGNEGAGFESCRSDEAGRFARTEGHYLSPFVGVAPTLDAETVDQDHLGPVFAIVVEPSVYLDDPPTWHQRRRSVNGAGVRMRRHHRVRTVFIRLEMDRPVFAHG